MTRTREFLRALGAGRMMLLALIVLLVLVAIAPGLFWGLDLVRDRETRAPIAYADAKRIATELRRRGILAGVTGRFDNVLKIRPPLVFGPEHVEVLITELDDLLDRFELRGGDDEKAPGAEW